MKNDCNGNAMRLIAAMILFVVSALYCGGSFSQQLSSSDIDEQLLKSRLNLRAAISKLKDTYSSGCAIRGGVDCDIAELADVSIKLLNIEIKYEAISKRETSEELAEKIRNIKRLSSEAHDSVDELIELMSAIK